MVKLSILDGVTIAITLSCLIIQAVRSSPTLQDWFFWLFSGSTLIVLWGWQNFPEARKQIAACLFIVALGFSLGVLK